MCGSDLCLYALKRQISESCCLCTLYYIVIECMPTLGIYCRSPSRLATMKSCLNLHAPIRVMNSCKRQKEGPSAAIQAKKMSHKKHTATAGIVVPKFDAFLCDARSSDSWRVVLERHGAGRCMYVLCTKLPLEGYKPRRFQPLA